MSTTGKKRQGRHLAEAVMGPLGVVGRKPGVGDLLRLLEGVKEVRVEDLFTERAIEPLDEGVLIGLPGLNIADGNAIRSASSPGSEGVAVPDPTVSSL